MVERNWFLHLPGVASPSPHPRAALGPPATARAFGVRVNSGDFLLVAPADSRERQEKSPNLIASGDPGTPRASEAAESYLNGPPAKKAR